MEGSFGALHMEAAVRRKLLASGIGENVAGMPVLSPMIRIKAFDHPPNTVEPAPIT
jgi:hypothetical protein